MKHRYLAGWVVSLALAASVASVNCGGDDDDTGTTTGTAGKAGAGGSAGATGSGAGGKGGATSSTTTIGTATGGAGGSGKAGGGGAGGSGGGSGGKAGGGGSAGTGGSGGQSDAGTDAKSDVSTDGPRPDATGDGASTDAADVSVTPDGGTDGSTSDAPSNDAADGAVPFSAVRAILSAKCTGCHRPRDAGAPLIDFLTDDGLYARLIAPLPDNQEGQCGFSDAGTDGGDGAAPENRRPIVPSDPGASFLYLKVAGTQPAGCGLRMPRRTLTLEDGGTAPVGCDGADGGAAANCLSQEQLDTILHWIEQGAPNN